MIQSNEEAILTQRKKRINEGSCLSVGIETKKKVKWIKRLFLFDSTTFEESGFFSLLGGCL